MLANLRVRAMVVCAIAATAALLAACGGSSHPSSSHTSSSAASSSAASAGRSTTTASASPAAARAHKPNIVFVLTDDLSMDLLPYMPRVKALEHRGLTLNNYFVTDSLCCPSRSSIFTGDVPHDTGVFTNQGSDGGIGAFYSHHDENNAFNVHLQQAGYRTAMMGKYLNGYMTNQSPVPDTYVPRGWNEWDVAGNGYPEFNYDLNQNGTVHHYGSAPSDYLVDVMSRLGDGFVTQTAKEHTPFFLELATFAPHAPYTPAPRYANAFPGLRAPEPPNFDVLPTDAPKWLAGVPPIGPRKDKRINRGFRKRVQDVQGVDDLISHLESTLKASGQLNNTYIVFSSDNGYHMSEYRLRPGKQTAFQTDIHVPLVVVGPGVKPGATSDAVSQNIDLASTFEQLGGTSSANDGHSLVPLLRGGTPAGWRDAALIEHHGPDLDRTGDPDFQTQVEGRPTTYEAMHTPNFTYVEYRDGEREYYDLRSDPFELHNIDAQLSPAQRTQLHSELAKMETCHGSDACWSAQHVSASP